MSILWGVENCPFPLTKPVAVNTGLALPRSLLYGRPVIHMEQNSGYLHSETPEPIVAKFGMVIMSAIWPSKPKFKPIAPVGASRQMGWISVSHDFDFAFFIYDQIFACAPILNRRTDFYAVWTSIPDYCINRGIKLQKVSDFPNFYPENTPKMGGNMHFKA